MRVFLNDGFDERTRAGETYATNGIVAYGVRPPGCAPAGLRNKGQHDLRESSPGAGRAPKATQSTSCTG
jgi:hypothetical protein